MSFVSICAMLEDMGYRREEIKHLTRSYVARVLQHNRDGETGRLRPLLKPQKKESQVEQLRRQLWQANCPEHRIEARVQEILKARKESGNGRTTKRKRGARRTGTT